MFAPLTLLFHLVEMIINFTWDSPAIGEGEADGFQRFRYDFPGFSGETAKGDRKKKRDIWFGHLSGTMDREKKKEKGQGRLGCAGAPLSGMAVRQTGMGSDDKKEKRGGNPDPPIAALGDVTASPPSHPREGRGKKRERGRVNSILRSCTRRFFFFRNRDCGEEEEKEGRRQSASSLSVLPGGAPRRMWKKKKKKKEEKFALITRLHSRHLQFLLPLSLARQD